MLGILKERAFTALNFSATLKTFILNFSLLQHVPSRFKSQDFQLCLGLRAAPFPGLDMLRTYISPSTFNAIHTSMGA